MQIYLDATAEQVRRIAELGGPVVMILVAVSVLALAVVLYKLWQFSAAGVGRHKALARAVAAWDAGEIGPLPGLSLAGPQVTSQALSIRR